VVFFDALRVKIREEAVVRSKAVYLALAVLPDGTRDILGIWVEQTEGAKFWMKVFTELKARGCHDILIAVTDGLKGMLTRQFVIASVLFVSACSGGSSSTPTPAPTTQTQALTWNLNGFVRSSAGGVIAGAVVAIVDGPDAGKEAMQRS
jgi:hypothetical protein